jgi:hypothetical protein
LVEKQTADLENQENAQLSPDPFLLLGVGSEDETPSTIDNRGGEWIGNAHTLYM